MRNKSTKKIGLFCFDGPLYRDRNGLYCSTTLTDEMFSRYFKVVDILYVVIRIFDDSRTCQELHMKCISSKQLIVIPVENIVTAQGILYKRFDFMKSIERIVLDADMIFARMPSIISNSVAQLCLKHNKPYLVEVGGCSWDSYINHGVKGKLIAPLVYFWERKYVSNASFAIYVTKNFLQKRYPNKNTKTNCSNVYLQEQSLEILDNRVKKIRASNLNRPVFGQVVASVDVRYKGEHLFIKAMSELKKMGILVRYEIVGPGNNAFLSRQAEIFGVKDQVVFLGAMKKEEVFSWLNSVDIYIQPSKQEGLPRSVIEAMSVGCPCLGSRIAGIPELLDEDCLFNPDKNKQIVIASKNLLNHEVLTQKAYTNFERAKEYNIVDIENRRQSIFVQYRDLID